MGENFLFTGKIKKYSGFSYGENFGKNSWGNLFERLVKETVSKAGDPHLHLFS
jgi:hypothetical protein